MLTRKRRIPAIGVMVEASSTESQESLPHVSVVRDSLLDNVWMSEPHVFSSGLIAQCGA
jgi:hypothetical protein